MGGIGYWRLVAIRAVHETARGLDYNSVERVVLHVVASIVRLPGALWEPQTQREVWKQHSLPRSPSC